MKFFTLSALLFVSLASARPSLKQRMAGFQLQNGMDAIELNDQFISLDATSSCTSGNACINGQFAKCVNGRYVLSPCSSGLICAALPLVNSAGTSVTCTTQEDLDARIAASGATDCTTPANATVPPPPSSVPPAATPMPKPGSGLTNSTNSTDAQTSLTLLSSVIATNFSQSGMDSCTSEADEMASLVSTNNFINWCATLPHLPITNGQQLKNGSCNPAPMGAIPSHSNMPSTKFVAPANLAVVPQNTTFQITLAVRNFATGFFVNSDTNYLSAPQQLDEHTGHIQGHTHVVIEALESLNQTTPTDPTKFAYFVALNNKADANGYLYANITGGLPKGAYKMSTLNTAMNHQPIVLPVAHRGTSDDTIYFTVDAGQTNTTTPVQNSPSYPSNTPIPTQTGGNTTDPCY